IQRYHAGPSDALPTVKNLDEYLAVMRERLTLVDPLFAAAATGVRDHQPLPRLAGFPNRWWVAGPFPNDSAHFDRTFAPETEIDLKAEYGPFKLAGRDAAGERARWQVAQAAPDGYIDLKALFGKAGTPLAYGVTWIDLDRPQRALLRIG